MSGERPVSWVAWRVTQDGEVETLVTLGSGSGARQHQERFADLETAEERFGVGFGDVVRRALTAGSRAGRWRP